jgi:hypothetical protein
MMNHQCKSQRLRVPSRIAAPEHVVGAGRDARQRTDSRAQSALPASSESFALHSSTRRNAPRVTGTLPSFLISLRVFGARLMLSVIVSVSTTEAARYRINRRNRRAA